jgi:PAS domain S-box-containing protein
LVIIVCYNEKTLLDRKLIKEGDLEMSYVGDFIVPFILLSIGVVILSSFATFLLLERVRHTVDIRRVKGLLFASITMGLGIWSMHFIWMLGYDFHANVEFNTFLTVLSLIIAIVFSLFSFHLVNYIKFKVFNNLLASIAMGMGIAGLHFIGMIAMQMQVEYDFDIPLVVMSILIGIFSSFFSFFIFSKTNSLNTIGLSAIILGLGISLKHYIAMEALVITNNAIEESSQRFKFDFIHGNISSDSLAYGVGFTTLIIIGAIILIAFNDKKVAEQKQKVTEEHYKSLVEHSPLLILSINHEFEITSVNPSGIAILKYKVEHLLGELVFDLFTIDDQKMIEESIEACKSGKTIEISGSILDAKNNSIPMVLTIIPNLVEGQYQGVFIKGRDITKETEYQARIKKAQKDLSETLRKQQGMTFKFIKFNGEFIHTLCEGELLSKLGFKPNMIVGKTLYNILPKEEADRKKSYYEKAWLGQKTSYEGIVNGVEYIAHLSPIIEDGVVKEVIGSSIEITEKKKVERELKKEKEFYQNILNTLTEAIILFNPDGEIRSINNKVHTMFGMSKEEFAQLTPNNSTFEIIEEDGTIFATAANPVTYERISREMFKGKVLGIKEINGEIRWLSINTKFLENELDHNKPSILISMSDISELKSHEVQLRETNALLETILNNLHVGILFTDLNRQIILNNKRFATLFDFKQERDNYRGDSTRNYIHLFYQNPKKADLLIDEIMSKGRPHKDEVETVDIKNLIRNYIPFFMEGSLKGHLWTFEDITESKNLENEILKAKEDAIKANDAKSEFLSKMSHELRTPLNAVLGFSQILELDHSLDSKQHSFVQEILKGGRHLLNLIDEVLDLSRIESGKLKISYDSIAISSVIEECIQLVLPIADSYNIRIFSNLTDCLVLGDELRIRQIILNLLDNAIKYNKENGIIHLKSSIENGNVIIKIRDTGIGISSESEKRIFEPFYRVNEKNVQGTGIGLSIVKQLIALMNGKIGFSSKIDVGTEFWLSLPIIEQQSVQHLIRETNNHNYIVVNKDTKRVLYIEDNPSNLQLVKELFVNESTITLKTAETGEEGLELVYKERFDLILLDINLPGINGFEVLSKIRKIEHSKDIPVIALSANAMESFVKDAKIHGFTDFITKPIHIPTFFRTISKNL